MRLSLTERLRNFALKPPKPGAPGAVADAPQSVEELEAAVHSANDKERLIGLFAAPFAAAIGFLVISALISHDPAALLKSGQPNKLHVNVSIYHELMFVLIGLSVLMLVMSMLRKRLYLGIVMALYGLAIFNLHYWGFGIPYIMCAAWLLVRAYRLQRELKEASGERPPRPGSPYRAASGPRQSKRYTPPSSSTRR